MRINWKIVFGSLLVGLIVVGCLLASFWQLSRLSERKELNAKIKSRMNQKPFELKSTEDIASNDEINSFEYRPIRMAGTFEESKQVLVAGRSFEGAPGFNVLTPLRLSSGNGTVYVNRGWISQPLGDSIIDSRVEAKNISPYGGYEKERQVVGLLRKNEPKRLIGSSKLNKDTLVSPLISSDSFSDLFEGKELETVANFWVQEEFQEIGSKRLPKSSPQREIFPKQISRPELNEKNHLSYAFQWLSFAVVAVITWIVIIRKQKKGTLN